MRLPGMGPFGPCRGLKVGGGALQGKVNLFFASFAKSLVRYYPNLLGIMLIGKEHTIDQMVPVIHGVAPLGPCRALIFFLGGGTSRGNYIFCSICNMLGSSKLGRNYAYGQATLNCSNGTCYPLDVWDQKSIN